MPSTSKPRLLLSWSSGKDSAWMLYVLQRQDLYEIVGLVTTINASAKRVAMHAVRTGLLAAPAAATGLPLWPVPIPSPCSNDAYETAMRAVIERARAAGVTHFAFGDLFLEDIRTYREQQLIGTGLLPLFPLWQRPTDTLAHEMVDGGLKAFLTCVDPRQLPAHFAGRAFDRTLLRELPSSVDPCGERGEFHSFAYGGPMFRNQIAVRVGDVVERDGFIFADVLPD